MNLKTLFLLTSILTMCFLNIKAQDSELILNGINLQQGSGEFLIEGGFDSEKHITVHYYKPKKFNSDSHVVMVIPGAGRNGDDYRNAWIEQSEKYNLLVLSPEYSEKHYPRFWNYNLGGMITDVKINKEKTGIESFSIEKNSKRWIYNDFDRIFNLVKKELKFNDDTYDMFGHSAGGQILHRLTIFKPNNKANRILASNSGWYTVPTDAEEFPYGISGITIKESKLEASFKSNLVLFLGEKDDANEKRGDLRHTQDLDKQGLHRFARGKHFYNTSKEVAKKSNLEFNWKLEIIPDLGHDYRGMSISAAEFLYGKK